MFQTYHRFLLSRNAGFVGVHIPSDVGISPQVKNNSLPAGFLYGEGGLTCPGVTFQVH